MTTRYATPLAFRQAVEQRLKDATNDSFQLARRRQLLVFARFLARVERLLGDAATLKGGLVLELRLRKARATKDVDLRLTGSSAEILDRLQAAGRLDLDDFLTFEVQPDGAHPEIQAEGMKYDGQRFRVECKLAGKIYGQRFGVDVAFADPILGEPDIVELENVLAFAGIPAPRVRLYPVETHIAEKLHAYTLPRARPNSRVKDLPDLALLGSIRPIEAPRLRAAIERTFAFRETHVPPSILPPPPATWAAPYARMAAEGELVWQTLEEVFTAARLFVDPVLAGSTDAVWEPLARKWQRVGR